MDAIQIPPAEIPLRQRVVTELELFCGPGSHIISPDHFQKVLKRLNLSFGAPAIDRIMLQCSVDRSGAVDWSKLKADVEARKASGNGSGGSGFSGPHGDADGQRGPAVAAARGFEFQTALEATTGSRLAPSSLPPELAKLSQGERVRAMSKELSTLFTALDTNRMTLDAFRAKLRDMGIVETPEVTRILHQPPLRFSSLYKALQADPVTVASATVSYAPPPVDLYRPVGSAYPRGGNAHAPTSSYSTKIGTAALEQPRLSPTALRHQQLHFQQSSDSPSAGAPVDSTMSHIPPAGRQYTVRPGSAAPSFNPITGQGVVGANETVTMRMDRKANIGPYNTAVLGDITQQPFAATHKAREDRSVLYNETGASALIYNKDLSELPPGALRDEGGPEVKFDKHCYKMGRGARGDEIYLKEQGAGELIHNGGRAASGPVQYSQHHPGNGDGNHTRHDNYRGGGLTDEERFESLTQASQRQGLYGKNDTQHRPATSAAYRTADKGMMREQVHSAIRLLDSGRITARQFRQELKTLTTTGAIGSSTGADLPLAVERLLQAYEREGSLPNAFPRFIKAFEPFFEAHAIPDPAALTAPSSSSSSAAAAAASSYGALGSRGPAVSRDAMMIRSDSTDLSRPVRPMTAGGGSGADADADGSYTATGDRKRFTEGHTSGGSFYSTHIDPYQKGHGDILGWNTAPTDGEAEQQASRRRVPDRKLYDQYSPAIDILSVQQRAQFADNVHLHAAATSRVPASTLGQASQEEARFKELISRRNINQERYRDHGNLIANLPGTEEDTQAELDLISGKGKARVAGSAVAARDRGGVDEPYAYRRT